MVGLTLFVERVFNNNIYRSSRAVLKVLKKKNIWSIHVTKDFMEYLSLILIDGRDVLLMYF